MPAKRQAIPAVASNREYMLNLACLQEYKGKTTGNNFKRELKPSIDSSSLSSRGGKTLNRGLPGLRRHGDSGDPRWGGNRQGSFKVEKPEWRFPEMPINPGEAEKTEDNGKGALHALLTKHGIDYIPSSNPLPFFYFGKKTPSNSLLKRRPRLPWSPIAILPRLSPKKPGSS